MIREMCGAWIYGTPFNCYQLQATQARKAYTQDFLDQQESSCIAAAHQHLE